MAEKIQYGSVLLYLNMEDMDTKLEDFILHFLELSATGPSVLCGFSLLNVCSYISVVALFQ